MSAVRLSGIVKRFGDVTAIAGVDLEIESGEFLVVLGPSGCGKTTLMRTVAGLEKPNAGSVHIGYRDVTALPPRKRGIAMVFQSYALYPHMTVASNIAFPLKAQGRTRNKAEREERVRQAARKGSIDPLLGPRARPPPPPAPARRRGGPARGSRRWSMLPLRAPCRTRSSRSALFLVRP
ncbi:MAG: ABC transporter ATP-binding protein, partial [Spirochaetaceae bacterium]|nr:ABC transporter ATP-binding protein [Spirochaetaceae bacterium]